MKILICEDDKQLGNQISRYLKRQGFEVLFYQSITEVYENLYAGADLFLLDVHLGKETAFDLCRLIHNTIQVPVLLLSADLQEGSMLKGYDHFAAEYIEKPVPPAVLLAKIKAAVKGNLETAPIQKGLYQLDMQTGIFSGPEGTFTLNRTENLLLKKLLLASPNPVHKEVLKNGVSPNGSDDTLRNRLSELRQHLPESIQILSLRGLGYRLVIEERQ